ncbi:unnamed protein product [Cochlearia groenlandica]
MGSKQNDTKRFISSTETKLCKKGCGYFVSQQSGMDLCTKCYTKIVNNHIALAKAFAQKTNNNTDHSISEIEKDIDLLYAIHTRKISSSSSSIKQEEEEEEEVVHVVVVDEPVRQNRCVCCNKKVGILGFKCKCGSSVFCGEHRHPEKHRCMFDFKGIGREDLEKANLVVKADKLERL